MLDNLYFIALLVVFIFCEKYCKPRNKSYYFSQIENFQSHDNTLQSFMQTLKLMIIVFISLSFSVKTEFVFIPIFITFMSLVAYIYLKNRV